MPLWSCLGLFLFFFFFFYAATPTPKRRCQSFSSLLSFSSSSFSQFAVFNHRRTNTISLPRWYLPTRRRAFLKKKQTQARQKRQRSAWRVVITFSALISRRRERGRSVGLQLLLPSLDSSLRICSLLYSLPPSFFFFLLILCTPLFFLSVLPSSLLFLFSSIYLTFFGGNFYPGLSHNLCSMSLILFLTGLVGGTRGSEKNGKMYLQWRES